MNVTGLPDTATRAARLDTGVGEFLVANNVPVYVYAVPLHRDDEVTGTLAVVNDASDIETRLSESMRDLLVHATVCRSW